MSKRKSKGEGAISDGVLICDLIICYMCGGDFSPIKRF